MGRRSDHTREELRALMLVTARDIAAKEGLTGLSARRVAREIGYSIGTIYNVFEDFDDLILHLNAETLDRLYERCTAKALVSEPEDALRSLARAYIDFVHDNPRLWSLLFEYRSLHPGPLREWYNDKFGRLFALMDGAMAPLFPPGRESEMRHSARVLRASVHGMCSLEAAGATAESATELVDTLISYYVAGLRRDLVSSAAG